jgi:hypothetical protein
MSYVVKISTRERGCAATMARVGWMPGRLRHPLTSRVRGDPGQVHSTPIELDDEQHIQPGQPDRLHGEEVARQHAGGLRAQVPGPREADAERGHAARGDNKQGSSHASRRYPDASGAILRSLIGD